MKTNDHIELVKSALPQALDYSAYRQLVNDLFAQGKTTGKDQSQQMLNYTELNIARMNKWDKYFHLPEDIRQQMVDYGREETWLVITEAWCGDAAHAVPVIARLAGFSDAIKLGYVFRDEHPELMSRFLTNGAMSIPKLIRLDSHDFSLIDTWGPRPLNLQQEFAMAKQRGDDMSEHKKQMQIWYARDRGQTIMKEIVSQLNLVLA